LLATGKARHQPLEGIGRRLRSRLDGMREVPSQSRLRNAEPRRGREQ